MALPDPIPTVTINSIAYDFARVGMADGNSIYQTGDGNDRLTISHSSRNRTRTLVRLDRQKITADTLNSALNRPYTAATYVVVDRDSVGWTSAELDYHFQLLSGLWAAGTPDYGLRVLKGEV